MSRPSVSVIVPFAGDVAEALVALALLRALQGRSGDELILADNAGTVPDAEDVRVVRATGERSPAHARNAGAAQASCDWLLFLDADVSAPPELIDSYFTHPVGEQVGALAGEIVGAPGERTLAARYGSARNFLSQAAHLAHPFMPRAAAANLMVRREAFRQLGGFAEGVRAAEDTDFCWRLQERGWKLELRSEAVVIHSYRPTIGQLRRQWRGYAAGRAWLARRHPGFHPEPALHRALRRGVAGRAQLPGSLRAEPPRRAASSPAARHTSRLERVQFLALDVLLGIEELVGLRMSNRAGAHTGRRHSRA